MAILNSKFDILRGWPDGSAIAEDFTISKKVAGVDATADNIFRAGRFVQIGVDGAGSAAAYTCASDASAINSDGTPLGLIIEGQEDYSSRMSNTVTCLIAGGYMVKLHNEADQSGFQAAVEGGANQFRAASTTEVAGAVSLAAGVQVCVFNGLLEPLDPATDKAKAIGYCVKYDSVDNTCEILVY